MIDGETTGVEGTEVGEGLTLDTPAPGQRLPHGRHGIPPEQVASHQRARLIAAIATCCASPGYGAATISDIVAVAGVSKATFYKFFQSKGECLLAAHDELSARLLATVDGACVEHPAGPEATQAALHAALDLLAADLDGAQLLTTAILCAGAAGMARHHALIDALATRLDPEAHDPVSPLAPDTAWGAVVILTAAISRAAVLGDPAALRGLEGEFSALLQLQR